MTRRPRFNILASNLSILLRWPGSLFSIVFSILIVFSDHMAWPIIYNMVKPILYFCNLKFFSFSFMTWLNWLQSLICGVAHYLAWPYMIFQSHTTTTVFLFLEFKIATQFSELLVILDDALDVTIKHLEMKYYE